MSNVPKSRRSISDLEFYKTALGIRIGITKWLLRDFGANPSTRTLSNVAKRHRMVESDRRTLEDIFDRYNLGDRLAETFPEWWLVNRRQKVDELCAELLLEIRKANAIYPMSIEEFSERRLHQDRAIGAIDALVEELQFIAEVLSQSIGIQVSMFEPWIELLMKEKKLLKGWRKSDNKVLSKIKSRGS